MSNEFEKLLNTMIDDDVQHLFGGESKVLAYMFAQALTHIPPYNEKYQGFDVQVQDQTSELIDLYVCNQTGTTNPTAAASINDYTITVADATGSALYDCINIVEGGKVFQSLISAIDGNDITFVSPLDMDITASAEVCFGEWDLSTANGSITPVVFEVCPPAGVKWDITKINFSIVDGGQMDDGLFGSIAQLTKGLVFRWVDGTTKNLFLISNNAGFREYGFVTAYSDKAPAGEYGINGNRQINDNGAVIRLDGDTNDKLQIIVQDNLTDLTKVAFILQGHAVED